jgi:hypothetical protein
MPNVDVLKTNLSVVSLWVASNDAKEEKSEGRHGSDSLALDTMIRAAG